jgi:hypothetical protein
MSNWPRFQDPLDRLFDWPKRSETSDDLWFYQLMRDKTRVYYAVDNEEHALQVFLDYYFCELDFERMVLDVAAVNRRAVRCYERCGFRSVSSHHQYAGSDDDLSFLKAEGYRDLRRFFKKDRYRNTMLAYDLELNRRDWLAQQKQ